jgi:large subunit ribosomal protein L30e
MSSGKVLLGAKQVKQYAKKKEAKMLIRANNNMNKDFSADNFEGVPTFTYPGTGKDLGAACGKPFSVSVLVVVDPGNSGILSLLREK